ncbi:hypothetical protein ID866_8027 [Astraeus odoratus]|nr:hypothetical protein ID866_8027 [Astraeus odoratus]
MARLYSLPWLVLKRSFISFNLVFAVISVLVESSNADSPVTVKFSPEADSSALQNVVQDNFLGISFELSPFNTLWGETPDNLPTAMENYLSNLRARIKSPLRIRIGGNSMDTATYVPDQTQMIIVTDPNADPDDIPVNFGPMLFDVSSAMAKAVGGLGHIVGDLEFIIGLSMQKPNNTNAVEVAEDATKLLENRLDSMLLGNEPDLYSSHGILPGYTIEDYVQGVGELLHDLENSPYGNLVPDTIVGGPTICCDWNLSDILTAGLSEYPFKYYTLQHYPQNICDGPNAKNQNITYFTSHTNIPVYTQWQAQGVDMAHTAKVPVVITEYNTVSCGGSNISDTFAAALWAVDAGLNYASSGMSAAHLHTREWGIRYNLFDPPTPETPTDPDWRTGSPYYAALFLSETFIPGGSVVVDLNLNDSISNPAATVAGYALHDKDGKMCKRLVLINYYRGDDADAGAQTFTLEGGAAFAAGVRVLTAPSIVERNNISWAGQTVGENGELQGTQSTQYYLDCIMGCNITVPGPGAALVLLNDTPDNTDFFVGDSTVAPLS